MSNTFNDEQWERELGMGPCRIFPLKFKVLTLQETGNISGILPVILFFLKFNATRVLVIVIKHGGIVPEMLLKEISST
jgi:hypothetical protein